MTKQKELNKIIAAATARRATAIARLQRAQHRRDDAACDRYYADIAYNNEIIDNANKDLFRLQFAAFV